MERIKTPAIKNVHKKFPTSGAYKWNLYQFSYYSGTSMYDHSLVSEIFPVKLLFIGVTTCRQPLIKTVSFASFIPNIEPSSRRMSGHH